MALIDINTIKNWFKTGMIPTQEQFWSVFDSFRHKNDTVQVSEVEGINELLATRASKQVLDNHIAQKGAPNGYAPLDEFTKLAAQYLNIVNDLVTGGSTALLSAEQGKVLQTQVSAINTLLTSDNVNLDTVQELVDAIETVQLSLSSILVNDLTTGGTTKALTAEMGKLLQTNKVDKVAGERLINAAEITKLAGLSNVVTTVKTILSTALATQDIAGFVSYINTLAAPLVVGANEIVEYKTSDTGRVFELLLRGRSFGVGQPAITAADVIEQTEFLNKDIRLGNYPSTRNDGQLPTNKVLAPDVSGNLKLYTIATAPAPYMEVLIPDSTLPSVTTDFTIKGAFFTPTMTVSIVGQTINYFTFISDNLVKVNVTTGAAEGLFAVTLNNGISATYANALMIVLGTIYKPLVSEWQAPTGVLDVSGGDTVKVVTYNSIGGNRWSKLLDNTKNYRVTFQFQKTPLSNAVTMEFLDIWQISLVKSSDNSDVFKINMYREDFRTRSGININTPLSGNVSYVYTYFGSSYQEALDGICSFVFSLRYIGGVMYLYRDSTLIYTFAQTVTEPLKLKVSTKSVDIKNIKYIELAS
jgi:hypothetical protein